MDIKGKLYSNSPVIDFPKDDLGLMYEKLYNKTSYSRILIGSRL